MTGSGRIQTKLVMRINCFILWRAPDDDGQRARTAPDDDGQQARTAPDDDGQRTRTAPDDVSCTIFFINIAQEFIKFTHCFVAIELLIFC